MSRRFIARRAEPDTVEQQDTALDDRRQLRTDYDALRKKLDGTEAQLRWHKEQLTDAQLATRVAKLRIEELDLELAVKAADLDREREHTAGFCSHAAELRGLKRAMSALETRVAELQRGNEGHESLGWSPRPTTPRGTLRGGRS